MGSFVCLFWIFTNPTLPLISTRIRNVWLPLNFGGMDTITSTVSHASNFVLFWRLCKPTSFCSFFTQYHGSIITSFVVTFLLPTGRKVWRQVKMWKRPTHTELFPRDLTRLRTSELQSKTLPSYLCVPSQCLINGKWNKQMDCSPEHGNIGHASYNFICTYSHCPLSHQAGTAVNGPGQWPLFGVEKGTYIDSVKPTLVVCELA